MLKWWSRWLAAAKPGQQSVLLIEELEPRVLLSADAAGVFSPDPDALQQQTPTELLLDDNLEPAPTQGIVQQESRSLELVFVDTDTPDYQSIVDSLTDQSTPSRQFEVILLDNNRDGIWQVSQALQNYSDVSAIHLVSHGGEGAVDLGNTRLDGDSLAVQQDLFLGWADYLTADADILIYGCKLAAGESGLALMRDLAGVTGADVAASDNLTGHASLGGDWVLEARVGQVDTQVFASRGLLESYRATLAAPDAVDDNLGDSYDDQIDSLNPESYFRLGDPSNITDEATPPNTGAVANGSVSQESGGALSGDSDDSLGFDPTDGDDDYIHIPHSSAYEIDNGTISLWFKTSTISGESLFSKDASGTAEGGHLSIYFSGSGAAAQVEVRLQNNTGSGTDSHYVASTGLSNLNDDQWHNVVFTFGASGMELYVDGELQDTDAYTGGMRGDGNDTPNQEPIALGASRRGSATGNTPPSGDYFQGSLDELAIVNSQLTAEQIQQLYRTATGPYILGEDGSLNIDAAAGVLANDDDGGEATTASLVSGPANAASFTLNADGSFNYTPNPDFSGTDSFVYEASNVDGADTATATITVNAVADAPGFWDYSHSVTLAGATPTANYPVELTLTEGVNGFSHANARSNGDDLRFHDSNGNALDYWIEEWNNGGSTTVWVEVADAGTTTIELIYGNAAATAQSSGANTFSYFDDFSGGSVGSLPAGWTLAPNAQDGTPASVFNDGGNFVFHDGANGVNGDVVYHGGSWTDLVVAQDFRVPSNGDPIADATLITRFQDPQNALAAGIHDGTTAKFWYTTTADGWTEIASVDISAFNVDDGNWHSQEVRVFGNTMELYIDGSFVDSVDVSPYGAPASGAAGFWSQENDREAYRDNHRVLDYDSASGIITATAGAVSTSVGFAIDENSPAATPVGSLRATDPDGDALSYSITAGNTGAWAGDAFAIDNNGLITVSNSAALNAEVTPLFTLTVEVDDGTGRSDTETVSITINDINDAPGGSVTVTGAASEGTTLNVTDSLSDEDGISGGITYHWQRDTGSGFTDIGVTGASYTLTQADVNADVRVEARYTDDGLTAETVASNTIANIANTNDAPGGSVTVTGAASEGTTLNVTDSLTDEDGISGAITYHWQRDTGAGFTDIGATGASYTLTQADVAADVRVEARYTDDFLNAEAVASNTIANVANTNDAPGGSVTVTGAATEGATLNASDTITDDDGISGAITYHWQRDTGSGFTDIGVTGASYTLTQADVNADVRVEARYTDDGLTAEAVASNTISSVANTNDAPGGSVTVTGAASEGTTLNVTDSLTDEDGISGGVTYHWQRDTGSGFTDIGVTGTSYTLTQADVNADVRVEARYTDDFLTAEAVVSNTIVSIANTNDAPSGTVVIDNTTPVEGDVLTATNTLADEDGISGAISYQWQRNGLNITGATGSTFTVAQVDSGSVISVVASYTDDFGNLEQVPSAGTAPVGNVNDPPGGAVSIDNSSPIQGDTLTASNTITDADGLGASISYQWLRDGVAITGASGDSYTTTQDDVGASLSVIARYTDGGGTPEAVSSGATNPVENLDEPGTGGVTIDNLAPAEGDVLTASNTLTDPDGLSGMVAYQWQRDGVDIPGQNGTIYITTASDVGAVISVVASYIDDFGGEGSFASVATSPVADLNSSPTGSVVVTGDTVEDATLTAANTLADTDGLGDISYQWQRDGEDIPGATGESYVLGQQDVGARLSVVASYVDGGGTAESRGSDPTVPVENRNDEPEGSITLTDTTPGPGTVLNAFGAVQDEDGIASEIRYQWMRNGEPIPGATGETYQVQDSDTGSVINVVATYIDGYGTEEDFTSGGVAVSAGADDAGAGDTPGEGPGDVPLADTPGEPVDEPGGINLPGEDPATGSGGAPVEQPAETPPGFAPPPADFGSDFQSGSGGGITLSLGDDLDIGQRAGSGGSAISLGSGEDLAGSDPTETEVILASADLEEELVDSLLDLIQDDDTEEELGLGAGSAALVEEAEELLEEDNTDAIAAVLTNHAMWDAIDRMHDQMERNDGGQLTREELVVQLVSTSSMGLFAALTVYALRGGALMASWLSTVPLWGTLDPLPVLGAKKDRRDRDSEQDTEDESKARDPDSLFSGQGSES